MAGASQEQEIDFSDLVDYDVIQAQNENAVCNVEESTPESKQESSQDAITVCPFSFSFPSFSILLPFLLFLSLFLSLLSLLSRLFFFIFFIFFGGKFLFLSLLANMKALRALYCTKKTR